MVWALTLRVFMFGGVGAVLSLDACAMHSSSRVVSWRVGAGLVTGGCTRSCVPTRETGGSFAELFQMSIASSW